MVTRTTEKTVRFEHAFAILGSEHRYPAGDYLVQTDEETIEQLSFTAWKRVATAILLRNGDVTQSIAIDPTELDLMLARDALLGEKS